jgi:hypothetical protein
MEEWRYSSAILDLDSRWRWVVSLTHRPLYPQGNSTWYPSDRRLDGLQSRSEPCTLLLLEIAPRPPLCQRSYPGSYILVYIYIYIYEVRHFSASLVTSSRDEYVQIRSSVLSVPRSLIFFQSGIQICTHLNGSLTSIHRMAHNHIA